MFQKWILIFAIIILSASFSGCNRGDRSEPAAEEEDGRIIPVTVERVRAGDLTTYIRAVSRLEAVKSVTVISEVAGKVEDLAVKEGDRVEKGAVLMRMEDEELKYELKEAEAAHALAEANYEKLVNLSRPQEIEAQRAKVESAASEREKARLEYERVKRLYEEGILPREAFDAARAGYQSSKSAHQAAKEGLDLLLEGARGEDISIARSQMEQAQARLSLAEKRLRDATILSPISGRVSRLPVVEGDRISAGSPVADIVDLRRLKVEAGLTQEEIRYAAEGVRVTFTTDAFPGQRFSGVIAYAGLVSEKKTGLFPIKIETSNDDEALRPGMIAQVEIPKESIKGAIIIPRDAVVDKREGRAAYVVEEGKANERRVELGITDGKRVAIRSGLQEGELLIVRGQEGLRPGDRVSVKRDEAPQ